MIFLVILIVETCAMKIIMNTNFHSNVIYDTKNENNANTQNIFV
jgi:hypothetical protein